MFLYNTPVSDIIPLANLKSLELLYIAGTQVSDVTPLANLKSLEHLWLNNTPVSKENYEMLKKSLPSLIIRGP